jgi:hypothetical protein
MNSSLKQKFNIVIRKTWKYTLSLVLILFVIAGYWWFTNNPEEAIAGWWNESWNYRKAIVINHEQVAGDLTNFPVLISLTDTDLGAHAQEDGDDIVFIDSEGKTLKHEIESFATSTGTLVAWVKIASLSSSVDTTLYMYYGNPSASSGQDPTNVWDSNYLGVWHMDNPSTASTSDSTSNSHNGTVKGSPTSTPGQIGNALDFDGESEGISFPGYKLSPGDITMSAWVKSPEAAQQRAGEYRLPVICETIASINWDHNSPNWDEAFGVKAGGEWDSAKFDSLGGETWYYLVGTFDGDTVKAYTDGQFSNQNTDPSTYQDPPTYDLEIAWTEGENDYFPGTIDEVRISNIVRSDAWIETEYNNQNDPASFISPQDEEVGPGPVGYWAFDRGFGQVAYDTMGNNNGTITGATWQDESMCVSGKCLYFDGSDDYIEVIDSDSISLTDEYTISLWVKTDITSSKPLIVKHQHNDFGPPFDVKGWYIYYISNQKFRTANFTDGMSSSLVDSKKTLEKNKWNLITTVFNGSTITQYINGTLDNSESSVVPTDGDDNLRIGRAAGGVNSYFSGFIDEIKIYPYARSAQQVNQDYIAGLAGIGTAHGVSASFGSQSDSWMSDGLVGYWKMDESATTSGAIDSSGNGNTGTYYGEASTTAGKFGDGGVFDGDNDYVRIDNAENFVSFSQGTVSLWYKPDSADLGDRLFNFNGSGDEIFLQISGDTDNLRFSREADYGTTYSVNATIPDVSSDNSWVHIVAAWDINADDTMSLAVNGSLTKSKVKFELPSAYSGNIYIGDGNGDDFDGQIDEVRIYNRALSPSEVSKLYQWAPGPVAHWKFDEKKGTTAYDSAASTTFSGGNHGTITGATWVIGRYGGALDFDGDNDYVNLGDLSIVENLGAMTISCWVKNNKTALTSNAEFIVQKEGAGADTFELVWRSSENVDFVVDTASGEQKGTYTDGIPDGSGNEWHYITGIYDGTSINVYVNGIKGDYSEAQSGTTNNSSQNMLIGGNGSYDDDWDGLIDDVRIYNYARTQKQIVQDMNAGHPAGGSPAGSEVLYLKFDEGKGGTAYDVSPHGNNCTLTPGSGGNDSVSDMWEINGKIGRAMEFDGTNDYLDCGSDDSIDSIFTSGGTVLAWIYPTGWGENSLGRIADKASDTGGSDGWLFLVNNNGSYPPIPSLRFAHAFDGGGGVWNTPANSLSLNNWYHVAVVYDKDSDSNVPIMYINAVEQILTEEDTPSGTAEPDSDETLLIGNHSTDRTFDGEIDEFKVYNFALTADEVKQEYNQSKTAVMGAVSTATTTLSTGQTGYVPDWSKAKAYCVPGDDTYCAPPVLDLDFNEKQGTTTYDKSGNGNDGVFTTVASSPTWKSAAHCHAGSCLEFDGSDDYVSIPGVPIDFQVSDYTVCAWIYLDSVSSDRDIYTSWGGWGSGNQQMRLYFSTTNDHLEISVHADNTYYATTSDNSIVAETWYYVCGIRDDTALKISLNGVMSPNQSTIVGAIDTWDGAADMIGIYPGQPTEAFYGMIDQVRIYNYVRTPAQIAWDYNKGKPIAHWRFDECQGGTIYDSSGNGNNGTLQLGISGDQIATGTCASSSASFWYNGRDGKINSAGSFDGNSDYINTTYEPNMATSASFAVSLWFKTNSTVTSRQSFLASQENDPGAEIRIGFETVGCGDGIIHSRLSDDDSAATQILDCGTYRVDDQAWHNMVVNYDKDNCLTQLYVDGKLDSQGTCSSVDNGSKNFTGAPWYIGATNDTADTHFFNGLIDEVKIFNYTLTAEQVKTEYNAGAVRFSD